MKTIINTIATFLIVVGIIAMAGSANDCDGACMDTANTLGEMLIVAEVYEHRRCEGYARQQRAFS